MIEFTYGTTPEAVLRERFKAECPDGYKMSFCVNSSDYEVTKSAVNQGIDSHLEAVTGSIDIKGNRLEMYIDENGMVCFLRRLLEMDDDAALSLRGDILYTLGIEEI